MNVGKKAACVDLSSPLEQQHIHIIYTHQKSHQTPTKMYSGCASARIIMYNLSSINYFIFCGVRYMLGN